MPELMVIRKKMPAYGDFPGEPGRIVPQMRLRNDTTLLRLHYIEEWQGREEDIVRCEDCGAMFESYHFRDNHCRLSLHSQADGHVVGHQIEGVARTPEMEARIAAPSRLEEAEPGGFIARIDEIDRTTGARTVPPEYSQSEVVRTRAKRRGRPRKNK